MLRHSPLPPLVLGAALALGIAVADPRKDATAMRSASLRPDASIPHGRVDRVVRVFRSEGLRP